MKYLRFTRPAFSTCIVWYIVHSVALARVILKPMGECSLFVNIYLSCVYKLVAVDRPVAGEGALNTWYIQQRLNTV